MLLDQFSVSIILKPLYCVAIPKQRVFKSDFGSNKLHVVLCVK